MTLKAKIKDYLCSPHVMQLATVDGNQPWICTVYFVTDDELNLYWLSWPERRHSREIAKHGKVAVAIAIKQDIPVVGIQAEGRAELVQDEPTIMQVMERYVSKYGAGKDFIKNYRAGTNHHRLYRFVPKKYVLFDEQNFYGDKTRQELIC